MTFIGHQPTQSSRQALALREAGWPPINRAAVNVW